VAGVSGVLVSAAGGAAAGGASERPALRLHWRVVSRGGGAASDGPFTLLYSQKRGVGGTLVNELTGGSTRVMLPSGCPGPVGGQEFLGDTWLLVPCPHSAMDLYALGTGQWKTVLIPAVCRHRFGHGPSCEPDDVGTDWIKYDEARGNLGERWLFQNIVTGVVRHDPTNAHTLPDLDSPRLAGRVCAPLRVPPAASQNTLALDGRFAVRTDSPGIFLEHCATHLHQLLTNAALDAKVAPAEVIWVGRPTRPVNGIFLPSRRRFRVSRPPGASSLVDVLIGARHLYVIGDIGRGATLNTTGVVWSAPLAALQG
jgi:hypothetical protein